MAMEVKVVPKSMPTTKRGGESAVEEDSVVSVAVVVVFMIFMIPVEVMGRDNWYGERCSEVEIVVTKKHCHGYSARWAEDVSSERLQTQGGAD